MVSQRVAAGLMITIAWAVPIGLGRAQTPPAKTPTGVKESVVVPAQENASADAPLTGPAADAMAASKKLMEAFNAGDTKAVLDSFLADGELIDEEGTVYLGHEEIGGLLKAFFETYPGVKTTANVEAIRLIADMALIDGTRVLDDKDGKSFSIIRYASIWKKTDAGYKLASLRDVKEPVLPTPREALEEIGWLVGEWMNEGADGKVSMKYRWDETGNFLIGSIEVTGIEGRPVMKSTQQVAWDASEGKFRSWTFDSDGGFGEGVWTPTETGWTMISKAVSPIGDRGTAVVQITIEGNDRFIVTGAHRMVEGIEEPGYQYTVVRRPPAAGN